MSEPALVDVDQLREMVLEGYREATADLARSYRTVRVPDFKQYEGIKLHVWKRIITGPDLGRPAEELAAQVVAELSSFEHGLVEGAKGQGRVLRCFLKGSEEPGIHLFHPPRARYNDGSIKVRHNFGVQVREQA